MDDLPPPVADLRPPRARSYRWWLLLPLIIAVLGVTLWRSIFTPEITTSAALDLSPTALDARLLAAEQSLARMQREKEALQQRLTDASARTSLLRDEILGVTQRSALIEDSVRQLASSKLDAQQALRLDEAELLLTLAQERWQLSGDAASAIRASELADGVIASLKDPRWVNLRQTLTQELTALRALPVDPRAQAAGELDALEALVPQLPAASFQLQSPRAGDSGFKRLLDALVQVRPSGEQDLLSPNDRDAGSAALALDLSLARHALEMRDTKAFRASLNRVDVWLRRLYADNAALNERRTRLHKLAVLPLRIELPVAGSTLAQLRVMQRQGIQAR